MLGLNTENYNTCHKEIKEYFNKIFCLCSLEDISSQNDQWNLRKPSQNPRRKFWCFWPKLTSKQQKYNKRIRDANTRKPMMVKMEFQCVGFHFVKYSCKLERMSTSAKSWVICKVQ